MNSDRRGRERMQVIRFQLRKRIAWLIDLAKAKGREGFDAKVDRLTYEYLHEMLDPKNGNTTIADYFALNAMPYEVPDDDGRDRV